MLYVFQVLVLGKVSSSMMGTFGALLEIILILYPFDRKVITKFVSPSSILQNALLNLTKITRR